MWHPAPASQTKLRRGRMGKDQANKIHYDEICNVLNAWIDEEEESELKGAIERVKPLIKVLEWTYVDDQDFSLTEEAEKRKQFVRNRRRRYEEEYGEAEEGEEPLEEIEEDKEDKEEVEKTSVSENGEKAEEKVEEKAEEDMEKSDSHMETGNAPEELSATGEPKEQAENEGSERKEQRGEKEERDDSVILDEDLFHKLGYGITSKIELSSHDAAHTATLRLHYSSHNWDIKDYEKPDFNLFCFSNTFTLRWENNPANPAPSSTSTSTTDDVTKTETTPVAMETTSTTQATSQITPTVPAATSTTGANDVTTSKDDVTKTETTLATPNTDNDATDARPVSELPGPQPTDFFTLVTGTLYGDKSKFDTHVSFTSENLSGLRRYLKFDEKEDIFFTEENFVMLLYFAAIAMSIEDQPFNELPALISSKVRRFFMKQILYELGANVGQYKYVIENLTYAMQEIKEKASQDRYSFKGGSSSARIIFGSDDEGEEESKANTKRGLDDGHDSQDSKKIKQNGH
eukprot:Phypoly_transcript_06961.p1 GENE.Phypoly_transcript_06961~~Phypoly_transcript_06961.p1  ORF type:complete len:517 (+),score=134.04 Phypoly_transcript_06961:107-1657(+)